MSHSWGDIKAKETFCLVSQAVQCLFNAAVHYLRGESFFFFHFLNMSYSPFRKLNPPEKLKIFLLKQNPKKSDENYIYTT